MIHPDDLRHICVADNIWELFHKAWGQAQASPEYDKAVFLRLESKLIQLQAHAAREKRHGEE